MNGEATWNIEVRHTCSKCDRLAVVYDDDDKPLCARHATIFMTAAKARPIAASENPTQDGLTEANLPER